MEKELKELFDMLTGFDKDNGFESKRKEMIETADKKARNCERVFICIDENGVMINGTGITLLAGLAMLCESLKRQGLPSELIEGAIKTGLERENKEKTKKEALKELLDMLGD